MFSPRISNRRLSDLFRNLATLLQSGVPILKALETAGRNAGDAKVRGAVQAIELDVKRGEDIAAAFRREQFPPLASEMIVVAEQTGQLPEILKHLAEHYDNLVKMRRAFLASIAWPAFQLVAAILIIALLILVLGWVAQVRGGESLDVLGWGLVGPTGAAVWLAMTFGTLSAIFVAYKVAANSTAGKRTLDPLLLRLPVAGRCMRSFALARFSWAFAMTQQTGMGLDKSLDISLRATANGAFIGESPKAVAMIRAGEELTDTLRATGLFPETFLQMVSVADEAGTVPETLDRLSPELEADARRSLSALVIACGVAIWMTVAAFIIFLIFSLASFYIGQIDEATKGL